MVLGYAPFHLFLLPVIALACLVGLVVKQTSARQAALVGFCFGFGMFGAGVSWVYVSLHTYGGMPAALAGVATALFCAFLALFPALFGVLCWLARRQTLTFYTLMVPALWTGTEWMRGTVFTGFPWLTAGYTQIANSALLGYAPVIGVYGVSAVVAASAALLYYLLCAPTTRKTMIVGLMLGIWALGTTLKQVAWTSPTGSPFSVALLQGNISQELKWRQEAVKPTLESYLSLLHKSNANLIVMPETAIPLFVDQVPSAYATALREHARTNNADLIVGILERYRDSGGMRYYNSAISMGVSLEQTYRKQHLVPFGEYIPAKGLFGWVLDTLRIPLNDMSAGAIPQPVLQLAAQKVAVNICFEDVFGEEIIQSLPAATILVNLSNIAWFGNSLAIPQHLQISQMRALETGRYMLRSTNTGATAIIDQRGRVLKQAQPHEAFVLTGIAQGFTGATPYVWWGNAPILMFIGAGALMALFSTRGHPTRKKNMHDV